MNKSLKILMLMLTISIIFPYNRLYATPSELFGTSLIADISEQVSPAVVAIESIHYVRTRSYGSGDPFF